MRADDITAIAAGVTQKWAKQRKAEERDAKAVERRQYMYISRVCHTDVAHKILPEAYAHVSGPRGLHASQRQLYYAVRDASGCSRGATCRSSISAASCCGSICNGRTPDRGRCPATREERSWNRTPAARCDRHPPDR